MSAGEGGYFVLYNGTPYAWKMAHNVSDNMAEWTFPDISPCQYVVFLFGSGC